MNVINELVIEIEDIAEDKSAYETFKSEGVIVYENGRRGYTREHWKEIEKEEAASKEAYEKSSLEEDQIAYNELKAEGFDFFVPVYGSFSEAVRELLSSIPEHELKEMREKFQNLMDKDDFYEIALCSTQEGFEYLQRQILSKAKCKRVIEGKGNGKSGGFMRVRG